MVGGKALNYQMGNRRLPLPRENGYKKAYELAYKLAGEQLAKVDIEEQCRKTGARYHEVNSKRFIIIEYLSQTYQISLSEMKVSLVGSGEDVPIRDKILILHYFVSAKGTPLANKLITFRELTEGSVYAPTFAKRAVKPLLDHFGKDPKLLLDVSGSLGGQKAEFGDIGVTINVFCRVTITIVIWHGDDELGPQGNILFDATISDYLTTEDITVLCETIAWRLVRLLK
ncbi:DUF3786 domain-containing protein [Chloroflexota bacterium]